MRKSRASKRKHKQPKKKYTLQEKYSFNVNIFSVVKTASLIIAVVLTIFFVLDFTKIEKMQIETGSHYASEEIKNMVVDDFLSKNALCLFLEYRYKKQENIPFVEYIDVELVNKNEVKIVVYDKNIIGCIEYMGNVIYFDKDGYFVETSHERQKNVPLITGVNFSDITLHKKMNVENKDMFNTIMNLTQQISKYGLEIDKIYFDYTYEVSLYAGDIEVMLGKDKNYNDKLAQLDNMLKEAKAEGLVGILHMENFKDPKETAIFDKKNENE